MFKRILFLIAMGVSSLLAMEPEALQAPQFLSVQDLLNQGEIHVVEGELDLGDLDLTSLEGLENIPNPEAITRLDLMGNDITLIPDRAFDRFINLEVLDLTDNPLIQVQADLIARNQNLKELHLENTKIVDIPPKFLDNNPNLEVLHLFDNKLESLPKGLLDRNTELKEFDASRNKLSALDPDLFRRQSRKLQSIYLSGNQLGSLPLGLLDPVGELEIFDVSGNKLTALDPNLLKYQSNLKNFWIIDNQLVEIPNITHLVQLKELYVAGNKRMKNFSPKIAKFIVQQKVMCDSPALFGEVKPYSLSQLISDLGENWRQQLIVVDPDGVVRLDISNRGLTDLQFNDSITFPDVQLINASNNFITAIPEDFFQVFVPEHNGKMPRFQNVFNIDLSGNLIRFLPLIWLERDLPGLDSIDLSNNQMETIDGFKGIRNYLRTLDLSYNKIVDIPADAFNALQKLQLLFLDNNQLSVLPKNVFRNLPSLQRLILRHNKLGNKDHYVFPPNAKVKFYPQEIPQLKMMAAKRVAQNMEKMSLLDVIKTLRKSPTDMHEAILMAASKNVALKMRNAYLVEGFFGVIHWLENKIKSAPTSEIMNNFKFLKQAMLLDMRKKSKDVQKAFVFLAPEALRNELIQAGIGETIPGEPKILPQGSPEITAYIKSLAGKNLVQVARMMRKMPENIDYIELMRVAPRDIRKKMHQTQNINNAIDSFEDFDPEFRIHAMPIFNELTPEEKRAFYEIISGEIKAFLRDQGFDPARN